MLDLGHSQHSVHVAASCQFKLKGARLSLVCGPVREGVFRSAGAASVDEDKVMSCVCLLKGA